MTNKHRRRVSIVVSFIVTSGGVLLLTLVAYFWALIEGGPNRAGNHDSLWLNSLLIIGGGFCLHLSMWFMKPQKVKGSHVAVFGSLIAVSSFALDSNFFALVVSGIGVAIAIYGVILSRTAKKPK